LAVSDIEVQLSLDFVRSAEGGGGVKVLSIVDLGGKVTGSETLGHTIRLRLEIADPEDLKTKHREIGSVVDRAT
jgi:hypothetical protein